MGPSPRGASVGITLGGVIDEGGPRWQPISRLPMLTAHVERGVQVATEQLLVLSLARQRPSVLDDAALAELTASFTGIRSNLVELFAEQGRRWQELDLGATDRRDVGRFVELAAQELNLIEQVLALAEELRADTVERNGQ